MRGLMPIVACAVPRTALGRSLPASAWLIRTAGMVMVASVPEIPGGGLPATLSAMMTPIAPAFWAFFTLTTKLQTPRSISAILPRRLVAIAEQPSVAVDSPPGPSSSASLARRTLPLTPGEVRGAPKVAVPTAKLPSEAGTLTVNSGVPACSTCGAAALTFLPVHTTWLVSTVAAFRCASLILGQAFLRVVL